MGIVCRFLKKACLQMKMRTLAICIGICFVVVFTALYYVTATDPKVPQRDPPLAGRKVQLGGGVVMEEMGGGDGRAAHPGGDHLDVGHGDNINIMRRPVELRHPHLARQIDVRAIMEGIPPEHTIFSTEELPTSQRLWPEIGNGHIATTVYSDTIHMNGLYNGKLRLSHRARIPSTCGIKTNPVGPFDSMSRRYTLDVGQGIFNETTTGSYFEIQHLMYAHRTFKELLVTELRIKRYDSSKPLVILIQKNKGHESEDINFEEKSSGISDTYYLHGTTKQPELNDTKPSEVHIFASVIPDNITMTEAMTEAHWMFITSISYSKNIADAMFQQGLRYFQTNTLRTSHVSGWASLWHRGSIDLIGNDELALQNYAAFYYLLSSLPLVNDPDWMFVGLSPSGLAKGITFEEYEGHVFWDQETWMYPPILLLHPEIAVLMLESRIRTLDAAKHQAKMRGYRGAMFPWESAFTGRDVTIEEQYSRYEQHITGDIALAVQQYLELTHNATFLTKKRGEELVLAIADFWASRVKMDEKKGQYVINDVMPPDEHHYPVNNSVYTNFIAKNSLLLPEYALGMIGKKASPMYREIADKIYIPYNEDEKYHPEYDGYKTGVKVKQADVVLLGYPLEMEMEEVLRSNDLKVYEPVTDVNGPAMTWGMFAIGWLELSEVAKAEKLLHRCMENAKGPFKVWTEEAAGSGAVNFITGMGGYLQTILFGYAGFRIKPDALYFNPTLPPNVTTFSVTGVNFHGSSLNFVINQNNVNVILTLANPEAGQLEVGLPGRIQSFPLILNEVVSIGRHKAYIRPKAKPS